MKNINLTLETGNIRDNSSSRSSFFSLLTPFALMLTLLASFPSISQGQRIEKTAIHPASTTAQHNPQDQLTQHPSQSKEASLQLGMQFELLRPRLKAPDGQTPASEINNLRTRETNNNQESLVF